MEVFGCFAEPINLIDKGATAWRENCGVDHEDYAFSILPFDNASEGVMAQLAMAGGVSKEESLVDLIGGIVGGSIVGGCSFSGQGEGYLDCEWGLG